MTESQPWPKIAVVGAGAVGGYFGGLLARGGTPVVMIGRPAFVKKESVSKRLRIWTPCAARKLCFFV